MKIALAGFGQEGKASYDYWSAGNELVIADERDEVSGLPSGAQAILGSDAFSKLQNFDLIIRSPGVNPSKLPYGDKVWSATNEFFKHCPAPVIGITGTKGKGTTSSLIASVLRAAGKTVHLVGNIGTPALSELPNIFEADIVVFELSSFQLWDITRSPHVAVVLGIEPDHLDVHNDFDDYIAAKANIVRHQSLTDTVVYNDANQIAVQIAQSAPSKKVPYMNDALMEQFGSSLVIPGKHNVQNAAAAVVAVTEYVDDVDVIKQGLSSFNGLPHRIKFIRETNGVSYYDDSYSSAPAASIAALKSFTGPKKIILGGYEKHANFDELAAYIAEYDDIHAVLIGQTKDRIAEDLSRAGVPLARYEVMSTTNFTDIVQRVAALAHPGDTVLLSPACASFGMFKNFTDRGEQFTQLVENL
jgi:UDP-N-acetylmuramoylalanine--D-glutamate ligase